MKNILEDMSESEKRRILESYKDPTQSKESKKKNAIELYEVELKKLKRALGEIKSSVKDETSSHILDACMYIIKRMDENVQDIIKY